MLKLIKDAYLTFEHWMDDVVDYWLELLRPFGVRLTLGLLGLVVLMGILFWQVTGSVMAFDVSGLTVTPTSIPNNPTATPIPSNPTSTPDPNPPPSNPPEVEAPIVLKSVNPQEATVGSLVTFSIVVRNTTGAPVSKVRVRDPIPNYLEVINVNTSLGRAELNLDNNVVNVYIDPLRDGDVATISIQVRVLAIAPRPVSFCNAAQITFNGGAVSTNQVCVSEPPTTSETPPPSGEIPTTPVVVDPPPTTPIIDDELPVRYMINFTCGYQPGVEVGEPPVKAGNYATSINIHNYSVQPITYSRRPSLYYSELESVRPPLIDRLASEIPPQSVLEINCNDVWKQAGVSPDVFIKGMIDIGLDAKLPVVAVFTTSIVDPMDITETGAGISIDVEYFEPFIDGR
jgi:uncharacterized repeat protein (TIGR01451 family)